MALEVRLLRKSYEDKLVLDDVSFTAKRGDVVGFLGPNGAGKSTTMKIITGDIAADGGQVFLNGQELRHYTKEVKRLMGYLPEHNPLYYDMYVREFLELIAGICGVKNKRRRISETMALVGLGQMAQKKIGALSKGYKQRTGLAAALLNDPSVLILDEPTSGLDPNQVLEIRTLIRDLGQEKTVLFSTHILQEVAAVCNKIVLIDKGRIIVERAMADISAAHRGYLMLTVAEEAGVKDFSVLGKYFTEIRDLGGGRFRFFATDYECLQGVLLDFIQKKGWHLRTLSTEPVSLEDFFATHTQKE